MLGYYLVTNENMNVYLKWVLIMIWEMGGLAFVMWLFIYSGLSSANYDLIAGIGGISFVGMLFVLTIYNRW